MRSVLCTIFCFHRRTTCRQRRATIPRSPCTPRHRQRRGRTRSRRCSKQTRPCTPTSTPAPSTTPPSPHASPRAPPTAPIHIGPTASPLARGRRRYRRHCRRRHSPPRRRSRPRFCRARSTWESSTRRPSAPSCRRLAPPAPPHNRTRHHPSRPADSDGKVDRPFFTSHLRKVTVKSRSTCFYLPPADSDGKKSIDLFLPPTCGQ